MRRLRALLAVASCVTHAVVVRPVCAQRALTSAARLPALPRERTEPVAHVARDTTLLGISPRWAPAASLIVPGTGQLALRQTRGAAYIAAEIYAWLVYREYTRDARDRRAEYKRTARVVARADFGGARDTSAWSYYESVSDFVASGQYNLTPGGTLTPETDVTTYNGHQWLAARSLYWLDPDVPPPATDPRYQNALNEYASHAVKGEFLWSWRNQGLQQQVYNDAIARENQVTRYRNTVINVMIVNHLLSAIDALTSVRLRESRGPNGERRYEAHVPWAPFGRGRRGPTH